MSNNAYEDLLEKRKLLHSVHTYEELDRVKEVVEKAKQRAIYESAEYRQLLVDNQTRVEMESKKRQYDTQMRIDEAMAEADIIRLQAENMRDQLMPRKVIQKSYDNGLFCPVCKGTNLNWSVQGKEKTPWCFKCNVKMVSPNDKSYIRSLSKDDAKKQVLKKLHGMP